MWWKKPPEYQRAYGYPSDYANVERNGSLEKVDPDEVEIGSIIVVQLGEKVPIDGIITEEKQRLTQALFTGESLPRDAEGDEIISGCII